MGVIARGQGGQGEFLVSGGIAERAALPVDGFNRFFPYRPIKEARLAEAASPDTAPENLAHRPVVDDIDKGHDKGIRIVEGIEIPDNPFADRRDVYKRQGELKDGFVSEMELRGFIKKCSKYGIRVSMLTAMVDNAYAQWARKDDESQEYRATKRWVRLIADFNSRASGDDEKLYGVHIDLEPDWEKEMCIRDRVRHTHLIDVGKAEREPDPDLFRVLCHACLLYTSSSAVGAEEDFFIRSYFLY